MWKFKEQHNGKSALENARWMKEQLEALVGVVPELLSAEVGISPALEQTAESAAAEAPAPVAAPSNAAGAPSNAAAPAPDCKDPVRALIFLYVVLPVYITGSVRRWFHQSGRFDHQWCTSPCTWHRCSGRNTSACHPGHTSL